MDEQDIQEQIRLLRQASEEIASTGMTTVDTFDRLRDSTNKFKQGINKAEEALDKFNRSALGKTSKAMGDLAKGVASSGLAARENRESFASLNPAIDAAASALGAIPIVGEAAGKVVAAVGKFATDELDKSVKAFQTLGAVGGISAEGVQGLRDNAIQAGLSFQQLADATGNKAGGLAFAFGSTATGLKQIAELTKAAEPFRNELLALGFNLQDQSETFVDYIDRSRRLGRAQEQDQRALALNSAEYAKNLTDLSRLTGMSVDQAQSELDAQMSNIRFRRAMSELDGDIQDAVSNVGVVIAGIGKDPALTQGFQDLVAGYGTQAGRDFAIATGGVGETVAAQLKAGAITEQEAISQIQAALKATYEKLPAQVFGAGTPFDNVSLGMANVATATIDYSKALQQGKDAAAATDPATKQMVDAQLALQQLAIQTDDLVNSHVFPVTTEIVKELSEAMSGLVGKVNQLASGELTSGDGAQGAGGFLEALLAGGAVGAAGGSIGGPMGALLGGGLGAILAGGMNLFNQFGGARAEGGPVDPGKSYLVGEEGPELMVPNQSGTIIPNELARDETFQRIMAMGSQASMGQNETELQKMMAKFAVYYSEGAHQAENSVAGRHMAKNALVMSELIKYRGSNYGSIVDEILRKQYQFDKWEDSVTSMLKSRPRDPSYLKSEEFGRINMQRAYQTAIISGLMGMMTDAPKTRSINELNRRGSGMHEHEGWRRHYERLQLGNLEIPPMINPKLKGAREGFRDGGIASGPKTGYSAMLHGTEAVVPLPDGRTIPVEVTNNESNSGLASLMENMIPLLEQVVTNTRTGADTSKKLLRASAS